jgi:peptidyl-prolyl cis-trans isomerase B (cyclophilin B)
MTDPNMPPVGPPSANQPPPPPGYGPPAVTPAAPAYQQQQPYQQQPYGQQQYGQQPYGQGAAEKYNILSIISLVTGILGISLVAIITGHIGLSQIGRSQEKGRGFAIAGLILGYLGLLAGIAALFIFFVFVAAYDTSTMSNG